MKYIHFYVSGGHLKKCVKTTHLRCHTGLHLKSSFTSHFREQKIKYTCLSTIETSVGTITIFTRRSGSCSGPGRCTDLITGQRVSGVLAERRQPGVVALSSLLAPSDWLSSPSNGQSCCLGSDGDGAYGSFGRPPARALDFFLRTEVACERAFQMQGYMASKMSRFLLSFFLMSPQT